MTEELDDQTEYLTAEEAEPAAELDLPGEVEAPAKAVPARSTSGALAASTAAAPAVTHRTAAVVVVARPT